jgi:hypothetical protein
MQRKVNRHEHELRPRADRSAHTGRAVHDRRPRATRTEFHLHGKTLFILTTDVLRLNVIGLDNCRLRHAQRSTCGAQIIGWESEGFLRPATPFEVPIIRTLRGDTNIDQHYAERNGFTYFYPDTSMDHLWIQAAAT